MPGETVSDIPVEVWLDNILESLSLPDLLNLGCTNLFFYLLPSDEPFWHRKLQQEYNFSGSDTARQTGWKFIYRRLRNPQVFVWVNGTVMLLRVADVVNETGRMHTTARGCADISSSLIAKIRATPQVSAVQTPHHSMNRQLKLGLC